MPGRPGLVDDIDNDLNPYDDDDDDDNEDEDDYYDNDDDNDNDDDTYTVPIRPFSD
jgi:hypothetical protein